MSDRWKYQVRINLGPGFAAAARRDPQDPSLGALPAILAKHEARLKCQYDAFADYVAEAEREGVDRYPLYAWTKATIENPVKKAKYIESFTLHVAGEEVYAKDLADALEADLQPLVDGRFITRLAKHDTNPANNPQPPARYRA
ncbi:MAG TPA: hypothetical protein VH184_07880 [Dongiaceae bacterium]|jgi:hypothetical protein|nr:hypothetical protein [Dongiaceae bacterium]